MPEPITKSPEVNDAEFDTWLRSQIEDVVATRDKDKKPDATAPQKTPIKVKLGENEYKFNDEGELNTAITNLVSNYNQALEEATKAKPVKEPEKTVETPKFDKEKWTQQFIEDPSAAIETALEHRFGFEKPVEVLKTALGIVEQQRRFIEASQFEKMNPDFPIQDAKASEVLGGVMNAAGLPPTAQGLNAAWAIAKQNKLINPKNLRDGNPGLDQTDPRQQRLDFEQVNRPMAPPIPGRRSDSSDVPLSQLRDLSLEDLEKLLKRAGQM